MIKMWKKSLMIALSSALALCAHASTIPTYPIASVNGPNLTLTDNAVVSINGIYAPLVSQWNSGDQIYFGQADITFFPPVIASIGGLPVTEPMFIIQNATQGSSAIGYLSSVPSLLPLLLETINPVNGTIILSDTTRWRICTVDRRYFIDWQTNDVILIGKNLGSNSGTFDAVIFNTTRLETVNAYQTF